MFKKSTFLLTAALLTPFTWAEEYSYDSISKKYPDVQLDSTAVKRAKMEGECLVGLKNLNFRKKDNFDAVAEWKQLSLIFVVRAVFSLQSAYHHGSSAIEIEKRRQNALGLALKTKSNSLATVFGTVDIMF